MYLFIYYYYYYYDVTLYISVIGCHNKHYDGGQTYEQAYHKCSVFHSCRHKRQRKYSQHLLSAI